MEHPDLDERLALITEAHLRYLETVAKELRRHVKGPFRLAGSITTELDDGALEAALREMREEQSRLREERFRDLESAAGLELIW